MTILFEFLTLIEEITTHLNQMEQFIVEYEKFIIVNDLNVFTTSEQDTYIDAPHNMSEENLQYARKRVDVLDRVINTRRDQIEDLFKEAWKKENALKKSDPNFKSAIKDKADAFKKIKDRYRN